MTNETCNATKNNGEPCTYEAKYPDGKCGIHSEENERQDPGGRPSKLEEYKDDILNGARQGMTIEGCARLAGVTEQTLHNWLNDHDEFFESFNRARAQGELQHLDSVNDSGSRFILERSFGYVKTEKREVDLEADVDATHSVTADFVTYSPEDNGDE